MYSQGKKLLEQEKNAVVPPQIVEKNLGDDNLTEKAKAADAILKALAPLLDSRERQIEQTQAVQKAMVDTSTLLGELVTAFQDLTMKLNGLEQAKNQNADLERDVLNKLNKIL
jgi:hypothetical protein